VEHIWDDLWNWVSPFYHRIPDRFYGFRKSLCFAPAVHLRQRAAGNGEIVRLTAAANEDDQRKQDDPRDFNSFAGLSLCHRSPSSKRTDLSNGWICAPLWVISNMD
jgi:hypothetical protein